MAPIFGGIHRARQSRSVIASSGRPNAIAEGAMGKRGRPFLHLGALLALVIAFAAAVVPAAPGNAQAGAITEFALSTGSGGPQGITPGPDGALWFTEHGGNRIGRITTSGIMTERFALPDDAGVFDRYFRTHGGPPRGLGTKFEGTITERRLPDGRAEVNVSLQTEKALFWVSSYKPNDPNDPDNFKCNVRTILFGTRYQDVLAGARPTLGESSLELRFTNTAPGARLPDFVQLVFQPLPAQVILLIDYRAQAKGPLRSNFGVRDGTRGKATVHQLCQAPCAPNFLFQREVIDLVVDRD